ncbi:hypothetical protein [Castellaniella sp.]|uniref:hypothetical protein n=1 Tax=Castellaniella sp. TaxID=1955812 RepID=UPI002AFEB0D9|nr:hypothetical protein [Castellaniella sp.]
MKNDLPGLLVGHLNAPYGPILTVESLRLAVADGSCRAIGIPEDQQALLAPMFVECAPALIGRACIHLGFDIRHAHALYLEWLAHGGQKVGRWEDAMRDLLV